MLNEHKKTSLNSSRFQSKLELGDRPSGCRYSHILIPIGSGHLDCPALTLGAEMAALHRAALTVLYVQPLAELSPPVERQISVHWLDAIDRLYEALNRNGGAASNGNLEFAESSRSKIGQLLDHRIPAHLRDCVKVRVECLTGDFAEVIARFADESSADLVIMSSGPVSRWLPVWPTPVRRVLKLTRLAVILVPTTMGRGQNGSARNLI